MSAESGPRHSSDRGTAARQGANSRAGASASNMARSLDADGRRQRAAIFGAVVLLALLALWSLSGSLSIGLGTGFLAAGVMVIVQGRRNDAAAKWQKGAAGERSTARLLRPLQRRGYVILHDRGLGGRDDRANIDHLVIGPTGVIVVDSKNWSKHTMVRHRRGQIWVGRVRGSKVIGGTAVERRRVSTVLTMELGERLGAPVQAAAVLAVHGAKLPYWRRPEIEGIPLLRARSVRRWITRLPALYDEAAVDQLAEAAERRFPPYTAPDRPLPGGFRA